MTFDHRSVRGARLGLALDSKLSAPHPPAMWMCRPTHMHVQAQAHTYACVSIYAYPPAMCGPTHMHVRPYKHVHKPCALNLHTLRSVRPSRSSMHTHRCVCTCTLVDMHMCGYTHQVHPSPKHSTPSTAPRAHFATPISQSSFHRAPFTRAAWICCSISLCSPS